MITEKYIYSENIFTQLITILSDSKKSTENDDSLSKEWTFYLMMPYKIYVW